MREKGVRNGRRAQRCAPQERIAQLLLALGASAPTWGGAAPGRNAPCSGAGRARHERLGNERWLSMRMGKRRGRLGGVSVGLIGLASMAQTGCAMPVDGGSASKGAEEDATTAAA